MRAAYVCIAALALLVAGVSVVSGKCELRINEEARRTASFHNNVPAPQLPANKLPKAYNWNDIDGKGRSMLAPSWNQHIPEYCGSCWLHGTASMVQDRLKIAKNGIGPDAMLARQVILNCGAFHDMGDGCGGGDSVDVLRYMAQFGLPDESCAPYSAKDHKVYGKDAKSCPADAYCRNCMPIDGEFQCWAVPTPVRYYVESYGVITEKGELPIMNELYARGPLACSMATPTEFDYGYIGEVATDPTNATNVDHVVEIVGWGEEDGMKYWLARNSWGTYWGDLGFFKVQRGVNALQIEAGDCWYATVSWQDEKDVRSGKKVGTMWGIMDKEKAERIIPEAGVKPHFRHDHGDKHRKRHGDRHRRHHDDANAAEPALRSKTFGAQAALRADA